MSESKPLLSICIPTFNRAAILDQTISSIVSQRGFNQDLIEIIISDNASDDNTEEVVKKYQAVYNNILYQKNQKNIQDENFPAVIDKANGVFRKLCNDNCAFSDGTLNLFLEVIKNNINEQPILFFLNANHRIKKRGVYKTNTFNSFLKFVSYWTTWIGGGGIWEDDFNRIDKFAGCETHLWQTKVILEMLEYKKKAVIVTDRIFNMIPKSLYPSQLDVHKHFEFFYTVFYLNYIDLLKSFLERNVMSMKTFRFLKYDILFDYFLKNRFEYFLLKINRIELSELFLRYFHEDEYYLWMLMYLKLFPFKRFVKKLFFISKSSIFYLRNNGLKQTVVKIIHTCTG